MSWDPYVRVLEVLTIRDTPDSRTKGDRGTCDFQDRHGKHPTVSQEIAGKWI